MHRKTQIDNGELMVLAQWESLKISFLNISVKPKLPLIIALFYQMKSRDEEEGSIVFFFVFF
jgi:hypothetical protein